jgi:hypothetical protein
MNTRIKAVPDDIEAIKALLIAEFICKACENHPAATSALPSHSRIHWPQTTAMVLFNKFGLHQPLNRQSETYAAEAMSISVSTLADYVGHGTVLLRGLVDLIEAHILSGECIHHDDTTVPVMASRQDHNGQDLGIRSRRLSLWRPTRPLSAITTRAPHRGRSAAAAHSVCRHPAG